MVSFKVLGEIFDEQTPAYNISALTVLVIRPSRSATDAIKLCPDLRKSYRNTAKNSARDGGQNRVELRAQRVAAARRDAQQLVGLGDGGDSRDSRFNVEHALEQG